MTRTAAVMVWFFLCCVVCGREESVSELLLTVTLGTGFESFQAFLQQNNY